MYRALRSIGLGRLRGASARSRGDLDRPLSAENIHQDKLALVRARAGVEAVEAGEQATARS
jgi:hypothetical protein